jgi:hypothetical protein
MSGGKEMIEGELVCGEEGRMWWVVRGKNVYASLIDITKGRKVVA